MRSRLPVVTLLATLILLAGSLSTPPPTDEGLRAPVLVELFTSEGCSSCPPADALLQRLDQSQPVSTAELIVLSEHVDYWNGIGWRDPYSSHEHSERQSAYAARFGSGGIYTPQMVVDGRFEFVGSDERRASQAIKEAAKAPKAPVHIALGSSDEKATIVHVEAGHYLPPPVGSQLAFSSRSRTTVTNRRSAGEKTPDEATACCRCAKPNAHWNGRWVQRVFPRLRCQIQESRQFEARRDRPGT